MLNATHTHTQLDTYNRFIGHKIHMYPYTYSYWLARQRVYALAIFESTNNSFRHINFYSIHSTPVRMVRWSCSILCSVVIPLIPAFYRSIQSLACVYGLCVSMCHVCIVCDLCYAIGISVDLVAQDACYLMCIVFRRRRKRKSRKKVHSKAFMWSKVLNNQTISSLSRR